MARRDPWMTSNPWWSGGFVVLAALLYAAPLRLGGAPAPFPLLAMPVVFVWASARPGPGAFAAAFAAGLAHDVVTGGPMGVWALGFLALAGLAVLQRGVIAGQSAGPIWASFAVSTLGVAVAAGFAGAVATGATPALAALTLDLVLTVAVAPVAARAAGGFERAGRGPGAEALR